MAEGGNMKFSEFNERFLGVELSWFQEMMLDGKLDYTGISTQIRSRNYMKTMIRNAQIVQAIRKGEEITILCASEEAAKRTFEGIVEFFEMVNKNG